MGNVKKQTFVSKFLVLESSETNSSTITCSFLVNLTAFIPFLRSCSCERCEGRLERKF